MRITVRLLAENDVVKSNKVFVKTDKFGYPTLIPKEIRDFILNKENQQFKRYRMIGGLLTVLSIHRVFPTKVTPKVDTILNPFTGVSKSLDIGLLTEALKELNMYQSYTKNKRCSLY